MSMAVSHTFQDEWTAARTAGKILDTKYLRVAERREEIITEPQPLPLTTADLIAETAQLWQWPGTQTMAVAQWLFERGLITYPRTAATQIAPAGLVDLRAAVIEYFGIEALSMMVEYILPTQNSDIETCSAKSQRDAHEAIRPTNPSRTPDTLDIPPDPRSQYQLIWQRSLASQMKPARLCRIIVTFENVPDVP